jgi:hypothetical protein
MTQAIEAPVATGELIDRITILEIKVARFTHPEQTANARTELMLLCQRRAAVLPPDPVVDALTARLKVVNERIWDLEDTIRECERRQDFGPTFVTAARSIYRSNDERAALKREINVATGSHLVEEKSYTGY